jgi:hypothetical protein
MKALRFVLAAVALVSVWLVVATGVGMLMGFIFPPRGDGAQFLFFWLDWRALPGLALGLWMGVRAYRAIASSPKAELE